MGSDTAERADKAPAVARAVRVLDLLADARGESVPLSDLARGLEAAKSSTLNVCAALEEGGLIRRTDTGYVLGRKTVTLGGAYLRALDPVLEFYRACADSELLAHERSQLAVLDGTEVLYIATHVGRAPFRLSAAVGSRYPASLTAVGNALLAELSDDEISDRFADPASRPSFTPRSTTSLRGLIAKIRATRERGYSLDEGEVYPGMAGFAIVVPPQSSGEVSLALGMSVLESELDKGRLDDYVSELRTVGRRMSNPMNLAVEALTGHVIA